MRNELVEGLIIGATIGLAVVAIRILSDGASEGLALALALAGAALCAIQLLLVIRRARRSAHPPSDRPAIDRPPAGRRTRRRQPFAHELNHNWTGLHDRPPGLSAGPPPEASKEQPDKTP